MEPADLNYTLSFRFLHKNERLLLKRVPFTPSAGRGVEHFLVDVLPIRSLRVSGRGNDDYKGQDRSLHLASVAASRDLRV